MGEIVKLTGQDGFMLSAYEASPESEPKGSIVVVQEVFGVNQHIKEVTDFFASQGYYAIAPSIFDRVEPNIELGYTESDMAIGIELAFQKLDRDIALRDIEIVISHAQAYGSVGIVGFCFGGLLTWLTACGSKHVRAAVSYYGGGVTDEASLVPNCPVMMHFGELDAHIPLEGVDAFGVAHPEVSIYTYLADHGFNCDHRASFNEGAASEAMERTLVFFEENL